MVEAAVTGGAGVMRVEAEGDVKVRVAEVMC